MAENTITHGWVTFYQAPKSSGNQIINITVETDCQIYSEQNILKL